MNRRSRTALVAISLLIALSLMLGCANTTTPAPVKAPTAQPQAAAPANQPVAAAPSVAEVKVGIVIPLSGSLSSGGDILKKAHDMAVDEINAAGGIKSLGGAKLKMVYGDTGGDPATASKETERLISVEKVSAVMGAFNSSATYPSTEVAERYKVPYVVPMANMDAITERGFKYTFRFERKGSMWGYDQIQFLKWLSDKYGKEGESKIKTLALVYEDTDQGQSQAAGWKKYAAEAGFTIVATLPYPRESADLTSAVLKVKSAKPDAVIMTSYISDAILLQNTYADQRANALAYLGSSSGHSFPSFLESVKDKAEYLFDLTEWTPDLDNAEGKKAFASFQAKYPGTTLNGGGAFTYAATYVLYDAIERAASADPQKIRDALATTKLSKGPAMLIPWTPLEFDENGQMKQSGMLVVQYQKGQRKVVWPESVATVKPIFPQPKWEDRLK